MKPSDIAHVPPIDKAGEMKIASQFLNRTRKALREKLTSREWRFWVCECLMQGEQQQEGDVN